MARIPRVTNKIFGENASTEGNNPDIAQFGAANAGTFKATSDISEIQALDAWGQGWAGAVTAAEQFPALPEMTGAQKVFSQQIGNVFQDGVPLYDAGTTYYTGSICIFNNAWYQSKIDDNINNNPDLTPAAWRDVTPLTCDMATGLYEGRDLSVVLAAEITDDTDLHTVIHNRIQNVNFNNIHVLDYFDIPLAGGTVGSYTVPAHTARMRIYGCDTYYNMGDTAIPHHIDFLNDYTIGVFVQWNGGNTNNGTSSVQNPWLSSIPYAVCNGVNNYSTSAQGSLAHGMDCSSGGILQMLPTSLQNVIITKRTWGDYRYSSSTQLCNASGFAWMDYGKIWIPHETEINSWQVNSYQRSTTWSQGVTNYDNLQRGLSVMYPGSRYRARITTDPITGGRTSYWECCPSGFDPALVCLVDGYGGANQNVATVTYISVRFGFRIA